MVSRKRSQQSKKGWQTRRWKAVKDAISRRAFEVWDKLPASEHDAILDFRQQILSTDKSGKDKHVREVIARKIERAGKRIDYFFEIMRQVFELDDHEIKSVLFSPKPRKK